MQKKTETFLFWQQLENADPATALAAETLLNALQFNDDGLLPVIAQCADSRRVLMLAWMNRAALQQTLATGQMVYYSRRRRQLWRKGETSGHTQQWVTLRADCDGDTLLAQVRQRGSACHTGRYSCFYIGIAPAAVIHADTE